jgi:heme-degrading monooxygenase HmoA
MRYARVSTYAIPEHRLDDAVRSFEAAVERIRGLEGLEDIYLLIDRERAHAITVTVWTSAGTLESSRIAATRARSEAARAVDGDVESVREYEVAMHEPGGA